MLRQCVFTFALTAALAFAQADSDAAKQPKTVLFVCQHGSAKSVIAAAHFNRLAAEQGLPYRAVARGVEPDEKIPAGVKSGLSADGLDVQGVTPKLVTEADVRPASRVVTLACELPVTKSLAEGKLTEWNDVPAVSENYAAARKVIVEHVQELLKSLAVR